MSKKETSNRQKSKYKQIKFSILTNNVIFQCCLRVLPEGFGFIQISYGTYEVLGMPIHTNYN